MDTQEKVACIRSQIQLYKITNTTNGKIYIGSAKEYKRRASQHVASLKQQKHSNKHLQASWNKWGEDAYLFEVVEVVEGDKGERFRVEQKYIDDLIKEDKWENTFNFKKKVKQKERSCFSKSPEETREKLSKSSKKRWKDKEYRKRITEARKKPGKTPNIKNFNQKNVKKLGRIKNAKRFTKNKWKTIGVKKKIKKNMQRR